MFAQRLFLPKFVFIIFFALGSVANADDLLRQTQNAIAEGAAELRANPIAVYDFGLNVFGVPIPLNGSPVQLSARYMSEPEIFMVTQGYVARHALALTMNPERRGNRPVNPTIQAVFEGKSDNIDSLPAHRDLDLHNVEQLFAGVRNARRFAVISRNTSFIADADTILLRMYQGQPALLAHEEIQKVKTHLLLASSLRGLPTSNPWNDIYEGPQVSQRLTESELIQNLQEIAFTDLGQKGPFTYVAMKMPANRDSRKTLFRFLLDRIDRHNTGSLSPSRSFLYSETDYPVRWDARILLRRYSGIQKSLCFDFLLGVL